MARPQYSQQKRQKELAKQRKKMEKQQRKLDNKERAPESPGEEGAVETTEDDDTDESESSA
jgi:hypothetical protein